MARHAASRWGKNDWVVSGNWATVFEEAGVDEYDEDALEQLDEADWPTIEVPRLDLDGDEFPAGWYRAIAARVRWELGARCWIEYVVGMAKTPPAQHPVRG